MSERDEPGAPPAGTVEPPEERPADATERDPVDDPAGPPSTPAGRPLHPVGPGGALLAPWRARVLAALIDSVITGVLALGIGYLAEALTGDNVMVIGEDRRDAVGLETIWNDVGVGLAATLLATMLYVVPMLTRTNGLTIGRRMAHTRLIRADQQPIELWFATTREVLLKGIGIAAVAMIPLLGPLLIFADYLWPLRDPERRALHDFPLDTRTIWTRD
ncbi:RDD family protein [Patulibacter defluvii]|uniref:RDD family protein n=1 Tax=Patulibacter defluvii TaxID=3095358 RepID=UPI002A75D142|nr:RDD family protein [Patulibacter sp. DM4]